MFRAQVEALRKMHKELLDDHNKLMAGGCLICRTAVPGRVCPDCYSCVSCGYGCDECAELRPNPPPL